MKKKLERIRHDFTAQVAAAGTPEEIEKVRVAFLGKKGALTEVLKGMKDLSAEERREIGALSNQLKEELEQAIAARGAALEKEAIEKQLAVEWEDLSWPTGLARGAAHPIAIVRRQVKEVFISMGFEVLDGPEMEEEENNFDKLNIPPDHPARDAQDTFWLDNGKLLRTHTSPVQVRGMLSHKPPFKFIAPGKVYRNEAVDASHEHTFHQIEGMVVDRGISVANLIYTMKTLLSGIFEKEVTVRLRPGFFPFVEPGFELDIRCLICGGKGCSVCKQRGWLELMPCGMVHPNVLRHGGIDPDEFSGFAFGLGLERLVMMRYGIDDIRLFHGADLRFFTQFSGR